MKKQNKNDYITGNTSFEDLRQALIKYIKKNPNKSNTSIAKKFGYTREHIYRIKKQMLKDETKLYFHGNKNKTPHNKVTKETETKVIEGYRDYVKNIVEYRGGHDPGISVIDYYNNSCKKKLGISYSSASRILNRNLIATPYITKRTKSIIRSTLKRIREEELEDNKINQKTLQIAETISFNIEAYEAEKYMFGECIEVDACQHPWFTKEKFHLYHAIDAHSGRLLAAYMEKEETNHGYMQMLDMLFKMYGIPQIMKSDKRKTFFTDDETKSALGRAVEELGCVVTCDSNPKFKPKVERSFKSVQQSAPGYFYIKKWKDPDIFNLNVNTYINWYNNRNKKLGPVKESMFVKKTKKEIDENFMIKIKRKVRNGIVKYKEKYFVPYDKNGARVLMEENAKVSLYINKDAKLFFKGNNKTYRAGEPPEKTLSDYELFCLRKKIDIAEPESASIHKAYQQNVAMIKQIAKQREELRLAWEQYHIKKKELENWERNLAKNS